VPIVRVNNIRDGRIETEDVLRVDPEIDANYQRSRLRGQEVVLSLVGSLGQSAIVPNHLADWNVARAVGVIPVINEIGPRWVALCLRSSVIQRYIYTWATTTVQATFNLRDVARLPIPLPPAQERQAIAHILGTLDDKIELNRRMNQTLEEMARALFKSWFVDFDPVRAKAEGREPVGMDGETASLFPDGFEDSELGEIPRGWTVGNIGQIARNAREPVVPSDMPPDTPYIGLEHMPRARIALADWGDAHEVTSGKSAFEEDDILFGKLRPYFHKVGFAPVAGVCSTDILVVRPLSRGWLGLLLEYLSGVEFINYTNASSSGTRMPRTNWRDMSRFRVILPDVRLAEFFTDTIILPFINRIRSNIRQSRTLVETREALLPKLLSGELRIDDPERFLEEAALT